MKHLAELEALLSNPGNVEKAKALVVARNSGENL